MANPCAIYRGSRIALGTMHSKEEAISKPVMRFLGAVLVVPRDINTDAFGTFTGEIARAGTMLEAGRAKARIAMARAGLTLGIASEGSYGPHPHLLFVPGGVELLLLIDDELGLEISETLVVPRTNYDSHTLVPGDNLDSILRDLRFPGHAVTVQPFVPETSIAGVRERSDHSIFKGIRSLCDLERAIAACAFASTAGKALLIPDMRAHMNPTRMAMIRLAASKLVKRIVSLCPECQTPGFGMTEVIRGLPCDWCGEPTRLAVGEIHRCARCGFQREKLLRGRHERADPGQCAFCNP